RRGRQQRAGLRLPEPRPPGQRRGSGRRQAPPHRQCRVRPPGVAGFRPRRLPRRRHRLRYPGFQPPPGRRLRGALVLPHRPHPGGFRLPPGGGRLSPPPVHGAGPVRAARRPLAILGALLATPLALVALLAGSEAGSRWVVAKALSLAAPEARVGYIEGTLARGLVLDDLHLPLASADIRVARVESAWNPWPLLGGHLSVQRLILTGLTIRLADDDPDREPPGPWPNLAPPLPVSLAGGDIRDLRIARGDANWRVARIVLAASSGRSRTRIRKLEVTQGEHRLQLAGQLGNRMPYPLRLDLAWSSRLPDGQPLAGRGTLAGDLRALNLHHRLSQPATVTTQARLGRAFAADRATLDLERLALSLESQWQALALSLPQLPTLA